MKERTTRTLIVVLGALAVAGGLFFLSPFGRVNAQGAAGWGTMMGGGWHTQMMGQYGGNMAAMHGSMSGVMAQMPAIHQQVTEALAARLDLTAAELQSALDEGQTLAQVAEAQGVNPEALRGVMVSTMEKALNDLVQAGQLDPDDAAAMRAHMAQNAGTCLTTDMSHMGGMMSAWDNN